MCPPENTHTLEALLPHRSGWPTRAPETFSKKVSLAQLFKLSNKTSTRFSSSGSWFRRQRRRTGER